MVYLWYVVDKERVGFFVNLVERLFDVGLICKYMQMLIY